MLFVARKVSEELKIICASKFDRRVFENSKLKSVAILPLVLNTGIKL